MREIILALLVAKFTGVRKDGLEALARSLALQATTQDEANALVDKITDAQVNEFVREYRAEIDKEVSNSIKTNEETLRKKYEFVEKKKVEPGNQETDVDPNDISEVVKKAVAEAVAPFQEKLSEYEKGSINQKRLQTLNEKLETCKDETFKEQTLKDFGRMVFNTDDEFTEYLNGKATDIANVNQRLANDGLGVTKPPLFSQKEESGISKEVAEYVASQSPENKTLSGKEI